MEQSRSEVANNGAPQIQLTPRARTAVLGAVLLGLFLAALDQTVVGTALPRIVTDLHGNSLYTWVVTAYLLSSTITVPIYGKLSDVYGRKRLLLIGVSIFLVGSALSGLSQNMTQLILFRAVQGLGAGALFPIALAVIGDLFTPRERGRYQGLFGAVFGLSFIVGPFVGGWITDNISWHWVFYVNLPIGLAALAIIATFLPNFRPSIPTRARDLDYLGIITFTGSIVPILLGLTNKGLTSGGKLLPWTDPSVGGLILLGVAILLVFLWAESRAKEPIIPLDLFRSRTFAGSNIAIFLISFGMFAAIIFLPRYFQAVRGYSATDSGYLIWPLLVGLISSSMLSGFTISKIGKYKLILLGGIALFTVGGYLMTHLQSTTGDGPLWFWMFLMGVGIGPAMSGFTVVVQNAVPMTRLGVATSTLTFLRQIGGSVGLAISGTLFSQTFVNKIPGQLAAQGVPRKIAFQLAHPRGADTSQNFTGVNLAVQLRHTLPPNLQPFIPKIVAGVHDAFSLSIGQVFWLTFFSSLAALVVTMIIREIPLRTQATLGGEAAAAVTGSEADVCGTPVEPERVMVP